jgi:hypothetical protein
MCHHDRTVETHPIPEPEDDTVDEHEGEGERKPDETRIVADD